MRRKILSEEIQKHLQPLENKIEQLTAEISSSKAETELYAREMQKALPTVSAEDLLLKLNVVLTELRNDTYLLNADNFDGIKAKQAKLWATFDAILKSCNINVYYLEPGSFVGEAAKIEEFKRWNVLSETPVNNRRLNTVKQCYSMTVEPAGGHLIMGEIGVYQADESAEVNRKVLKNTSIADVKTPVYARPDAENVTQVHILPENSFPEKVDEPKTDIVFISEEQVPAVAVETEPTPATAVLSQTNSSTDEAQSLNTRLYSSTGVYPFNSGRDFTIVRDRKKPATVKFEKSAESRGIVKYSDNKLVSVFNGSKFLGEYYNLGKVHDISVVSICGKEYNFPNSADVSAQAVYKYVVEEGMLYLFLCVRVWGDAEKSFKYGDEQVVKLAKVD